MDNLTLNDLLLKVSEYNDDGTELIKKPMISQKKFTEDKSAKVEKLTLCIL